MNVGEVKHVMLLNASTWVAASPAPEGDDAQAISERHTSVRLSPSTVGEAAHPSPERQNEDRGLSDASSGDDDAQLEGERLDSPRSPSSEPNAGEQHSAAVNADKRFAVSPATPSGDDDAHLRTDRPENNRSSSPDPNAGEQHMKALTAITLIAASPAADGDDAQLGLERQDIDRSPSSDLNAGEQHTGSVNAPNWLAASPASDGDDAHLRDERLKKVRSSSSDPAVALVCVRLAELQVRRRFVIKATNRQVNSATALIRRVLGFDPNASEKAREAVKARAQRMAARAFGGKPQAAADQSVFASVATDIGVVALAIAPLVSRRKEIEREMIVAARALPVCSWAQAVAGFGEIGLPVTIGETGDLSRYPNFRHVWKRLGLMPFEGKACSVWRRHGSMPEGGWERVGYSPQRLAEVYACVAESLLKHQIKAAAKSGTDFGKPKGRYGEVYVARREKTKLAHPDWPKAHAKADAMRIMTKALIADLWAEWPR